MNYAVSDLHGDYERYKKLLETIDFRDSDTLYVLGDVIDRGPDGVQILQDMMARSNVFSILGNHEFMAALSLKWLQEEITREALAALDDTALGAFTDWMNNGGEPTLRAFSALPQEERREIYEYLLEMPLFEEVEAGGRSFVLVHAGLDNFSPDRPLEDYGPEEVLFHRPPVDFEVEGYAFREKDRYILFGHTPTRLMREDQKDEIYEAGRLIGIDCGCGYDGRLGCLCLDTMEKIYV